MHQTNWSDFESDAAPPRRTAPMTLGVAILLLLATLAVYVLTLAPSVGWGDQAAVQTDAVRTRLGSGATDHPLYVALAAAALRLPLAGDPAYRVNLAGAMCGALAVGVVFLWVLALLDRARLGGAPRTRLLFAATGALSLGLAHSLWLRSVTASPAALAVLLFALVVWLWVRRLLGGGSINILVAAFLLGLSLAVDIGLSVFVPIFLLSGLWLLWRPPTPPVHGRGRFRRAVLTVETEPAGDDAIESPPAGASSPGAPGGGIPGVSAPPTGSTSGLRRRPSLLAAAVSLLLAFVIGLLPLIGLEVADLVRTPLRADFFEEIVPGHSGPVVAAVDHVARQAIGGRLLPLVPFAAQNTRIVGLGAVLLYNFLMFASAFAVIGALALLVRRGTIAAGILLILLFVVSLAAAVALPSGDFAGAALPACAVLAVWVGIGAGTVGRGRPSWIAPLVALLVIGSPIATYFIVPTLSPNRAELRQLAGWVAPAAPRGGSVEQLRPWRADLRAPGELGRAVLGDVAAAADTATLAVIESERGTFSHPLLYLQRVEGLGAGIAVASVSGDSTALGSQLTLLLDRHLDRRPLFVATADTVDLATAASGELPAGLSERVRALPHGAVYELVPLSVTGISGTVPTAGGRHAPADLRATPGHGAATGTPEGSSGMLMGLVSAQSSASPLLHEADSLFAAGAFWQAAATYGSALHALDGESAEQSTARQSGPATTADRPRAVTEPGVYARYAVALTQARMPSLSGQIQEQFFGMAADSAMAHETLGHLFLSAGNPERAIQELQAAALARPDDAEIQRALGAACADAGRFDQARSHLRQALSLQPDNAAALFELGQVLEASGDGQAAINIYRRYLEVGATEHADEVRQRLRELTGQ